MADLAATVVWQVQNGGDDEAGQERQGQVMSDTVLETRNLTKYFGKKPALDHLNLTVERGCIYGLLGRNGAGKTTAIELLLGLISPTSGSSSMLGCGFTGPDARGATEDRLRQRGPQALSLDAHRPIGRLPAGVFSGPVGCKTLRPDAGLFRPLAEAEDQAPFQRPACAGIACRCITSDPGPKAAEPTRRTSPPSAGSTTMW